MVDYGYYSEVFGSRVIGEGDFPSTARAVYDIFAMICTSDIGDDDECRRAVCYECDYLYANGGYNAINGIKSTKSESAGDYSISYGEKSGVCTVFGIPLSPISYNILLRGGYISRVINGGDDLG